VKDVVVRGLVAGLAAKRGPETDPELAAEIRGVAKLTGITEQAIQAVQMLYELQTLMIPIENVTLPWRGPGCTGIIATSSIDGMVYHARNLDFSPKEFMQNLTYQAKFTRGGVEVFRAQMIAAYSLIVTGAKMGPNGFAIETNTRYTDHRGGNEEMLHNLLVEKRPLNNWVVRKTLETAADYEAAVTALSTTKFVATQYAIVSGVKKGTILARNPDGVAKALVLGQDNFECRDDYIIITNFDYYFYDIREWFDPTGGKIGRPRRIVAQRALNATQEGQLTPEILFNVINTLGVIATDTIFQAIINIESGLWNVSLPDFVKY